MWEHNAASPVEMAAADAAAESEERPDIGEDGVVIKTVVEQMRYDVPAFTVAAGEPVTILFDNEDYTPHNLVIGRPGSGDAIGNAADALGMDRVELRARNMIRPDELPYRTRTFLEYDSGDYERALRRAVEMIDELPAPDDGRARGVGICSYVQMDDAECRGWEARRVFVDGANRPRD